MTDYHRVARMFASSTQVFPAHDILPNPEPTMKEYRATMVVQITWFTLTIIGLSLLATIVLLSDNRDAPWQVIVAIVAMATLPQLLVLYYRLKDNWESSKKPA